MNLTSLHIFDGRDLDVHLEPSPITVLFGPNDAGKTNLLTAIAEVVSCAPSGPAVGFEFRLDIAHRGEADFLRRCLRNLVAETSRKLPQFAQREGADGDADANPLAGAGPDLPELTTELERWVLARLDEAAIDWQTVERPVRTLVAQMVRRAPRLQLFVVPHTWSLFFGYGRSNGLSDASGDALAQLQQLGVDAWRPITRFGAMRSDDGDQPELWLPLIGELLRSDAFPVARSSLEIDAHIELLRRQASGAVGASSAQLAADLLHIDGRPITPALLTGFDRPVMEGLGTTAHRELTHAFAEQLVRRLTDLRPAASEDEAMLAGWEKMEALGASLPAPAGKRRRDQYQDPGADGYDREVLAQLLFPRVASDGAAPVADPYGQEILVSLSARATSLLPSFIRGRFSFVVSADLATEDVVTTQLERQVDGRTIPLHHASSGVRRWADIALGEALRELEAETAEIDRESARQLERLGIADEMREDGLGRPLYLLDEPEAHLHPEAQREAAAWVAERARDGAEFVIATHSPSFLNIPYGSTSYVHLHRDEEGITRSVTIDESEPESLRKAASSAGYGSVAELLQLTRAILIVEGPHDKTVLSALAGHELSRARVLVQPIIGTRNAQCIAEIDLLRDTGLPIFVMFDNIAAADKAKLDKLKNTNRREAKRITSNRSEVKEAALLYYHWPPDIAAPSFISFPYPDIICAVPERAIREVLTHPDRFPGWETLVADYRQHSTPINFKDYFASTTGEKTINIPWVRRASRSIKQTDFESSVLYKPLSELLANIDPQALAAGPTRSTSGSRST